MSLSCNSCLHSFISNVSTSFLKANANIFRKWHCAIIKYFTGNVVILIYFLQINPFYLKIPSMKAVINDKWSNKVTYGGERDIDITISERYTFDFTKNSQYQVFQKPEIYIYF